MPHTDGPAYHPVTACLSLGTPCSFAFEPRLRPEEIGSPLAPKWRLEMELPPRSLVVFFGDLYKNALHSAFGMRGEAVGDKRVSLTLRRLL